MDALDRFEAWFITGSQRLYGEEVLREVDAHAREIVDALNAFGSLPVRVVTKPVVASAEAIEAVCLEANAEVKCIGVIAWMHTFSPARAWIPGLVALQKPVLHLHTQFNRDLPWREIDMDFMNLNQSAHGDREFGYIQTRLRKSRKTVVGHWADPHVISEIEVWERAAAGWREAHLLRIARFGDNMRDVAVTEGDKTEAQYRLGFSVNGYGVSDLAAVIRDVPDVDVDRLVDQYDEAYDVTRPLRPEGDRRSDLRDAARIEIGLRSFLDSRGCRAFTDTFEDLDGLGQLPGIAVQRLMADGYGFGAEGDWKSAALVRIMKVIGTGRPGGTSFMEDYTYHFGTTDPLVLGAHMLEVCPTISAGRPSCEIHPLSIGGKSDPVRLVFTAAPGPAITVGLIDLGERFRILLNVVDVESPPEPLDRLAVARAVWAPRPNLRIAAEAWLTAGGPHHTSFSQAVEPSHLVDFAEIAGVELVTIDESTTVAAFKNELRWNQAYHRIAAGA